MQSATYCCVLSLAAYRADRDSAPQADDDAVQHELYGVIAAVDQPQAHAAARELIVDAEAGRDDAEADRETAQRGIGERGGRAEQMREGERRDQREQEADAEHAR